MRDNDIIEAIDRIRQRNIAFILNSEEETMKYLFPMSIPRKEIMKRDKPLLKATEKIYKRKEHFDM